MQEAPTPPGASDASGAQCRHFGVCGGCQRQDLPYPEQCARKAAALEALFRDWWKASIPLTPSPVVWHYRNKVDFSFGREYFEQPPPPGTPRRTLLGYRQKGRWFAPLTVHECLIAPEGVDGLLPGVRAWVETSGLSAFRSQRSGSEGHLKILLVREAKRTGDRMVALITHPGVAPTLMEDFAEAVTAHWPARSVVHGVSSAMNDAGLMESVQALRGETHIHEALQVPGRDAPLRFRISPMSFFQTNTLATELLYGAIRAEVQATGAAFLYDLYGGAGGIAFSCADLVEQVLSVESVEAASEDGRHNASINGIENVAFLTADVQRYLGARKIGGGLQPGAAVVVDPPRSGLTPKALRRLSELAPAHIVYVSCKPERFAEELKAFTEHYRVVSLQAFDLFPHTDHVELVARLSRNDAAAPSAG